jgi:hypothetical protein
MNSDLLEQTLRTFRWVGRALVALSILVAIAIFVPANFPLPESKSPLAPIGPAYFACLDQGCWNRVRTDISWGDLADRVGADQTRLKAGNPQVVGDTVRAGEVVRIQADMARR